MNIRKRREPKIILSSFYKLTMIFSIVVLSSLPLAASDEDKEIWLDTVILSPEDESPDFDVLESGSLATKLVPAPQHSFEEPFVVQGLRIGPDVPSCSHSLFCPVSSSETKEDPDRSGFLCFEFVRKDQIQSWQCYPAPTSGEYLISSTCPSHPIRDRPRLPVEKAQSEFLKNCEQEYTIDCSSSGPMPLISVRSTSAPTTAGDFAALRNQPFEGFPKRPKPIYPPKSQANQPYQGPGQSIIFKRGSEEEPTSLIQRACEMPTFNQAAEARLRVNGAEFGCIKLCNDTEHSKRAGIISKFVRKGPSNIWHYHFPETRAEPPKKKRYND